MKSIHAIQLLHDRMVAVILGQTPLALSIEAAQALKLQCGPLCWMLGHHDNVAFALNMAELRRELADRSFHLSGAAPFKGEELAGLREAGERYAIIRGPEAIAIQCLSCGIVSRRPHDLQLLYCGKCQEYHLANLDKDLAAIRNAAIGQGVRLHGSAS